MKVYSVLLIIVFSLTTNIFSQVQFTRHPITTSADLASSVYAVDVDGDGDMDVLSASADDDKIAWYESPPVAARFSAGPTSGLVPLTVQFADNSTGAITNWFWVFGDDSISTEQNPMHVYNEADTFAVSLTVTGPGGSDALVQSNYITVYAPPSASFSADSTAGIVPLTVQFTDRSTGPITNWFWVFGDDSTSIEQNPIHIYNKADTFTVSLTVTGPGGTNTLLRENYITIIDTDPTSVPEVSDVLPSQFKLYNNYPNPFNPQTTIEFDVTANLPVTLKIYDLQGRETATLIDEQLPPSHYKVTFNARDLASGVYFYHIRMGAFHAVKKMVLIR